MKNLFLGLLAAVLLFGIDAKAQKITEMSKDADFVTYINNYNAFQAKGTNKDLFRKIYGDSKLTEDELPDFYKVFGTDKAGYQSYITQQRNLLRKLDAKYQLTDPNNEQQLIIEIGELSQSEGKNCLRTYIGECARIIGLVALGHTACLVADVTVVAGVVCHAGVTLWGLAAGDRAWLAYKKCTESEAK
jgi:hypothetical protein